MSFKVIKKLPSVDDIIDLIPLSPNGYETIRQHRLEISDIISGKDSRMLLIVGPCSAWPSPAILEYAKRLLNLSNIVQDRIKIVMRCYIQKPRTVKGWTGPANQPDPLSSPNLEAGMHYSRSLMVTLVEMGLAIADEALFTHNARGFLELLSWVAIGARSSEDQEHRIFASSIDCPVGIKNPTSGSIKIGVNGVIAAQNHHFAVFDGYEVETMGNKFAHLVLRGGVEGANYSIEHINDALNLLIKHQVNHPALVIDVSHDNCVVDGVKRYDLQGEIILNVIHSIKDKPELNNLLKGFMLESFLQSGNQKVTLGKSINLDGLSITDPCLGWDETQQFIYKLYKELV